MMKINDMQKELEKIAKSVGDECLCDMGPPWDKCLPCLAAGVLNESAEIMRDGYYIVMKEKKAREINNQKL